LVAAATAQQVDQQIINIGSGIGTSINDLISYITTITEQEPQVLYVHSETGGVSRLVADITLAQRLLNYAPQIDLMTGLEQLRLFDRRFQEATRRT
jgi:UDP-glucose 4-epimerase